MDLQDEEGGIVLNSLKSVVDEVGSIVLNSLKSVDDEVGGIVLNSLKSGDDEVGGIVLNSLKSVDDALYTRGCCDNLNHNTTKSQGKPIRCFQTVLENRVYLCDEVFRICYLYCFFFFLSFTMANIKQ